MKHELFALIPQSTKNIIVNNELDIGNPPLFLPALSMFRMVSLGSSYVDELGDRTRIVEARVRGKPHEGRANLDDHATSVEYAYISRAKPIGPRSITPIRWRAR